MAFIKDGEVVATGDLRAHPDDEVRVVVRARKLSQEAIAGLTKWTTSSRLDDERLSFVTRSPSDLPDILRHLIAAGADKSMLWMAAIGVACFCSSRVRQLGVVQFEPQERAGVKFGPSYRTELRTQPVGRAVPTPSPSA